jgi:hypothetical protein
MVVAGFVLVAAGCGRLIRPLFGVRPALSLICLSLNSYHSTQHA